MEGGLVCMASGTAELLSCEPLAQRAVPGEVKMTPLGPGTL